MNNVLASTITTAVIRPVGDRQRLAERIFRFALAVNLALTVFALVAAFTGFGNRIAGQYLFNPEAAGRFLFSLVVFNGIWALIWYGVKNLLLAKFVGMSRDDRRLVFSSRMSQPFNLEGLLARYPERRIRITDMIGRRGRFITLAMAGFYFLYADIAAKHSDNFASAFGPQTVFDAMLTNWLFIALFYVNGFLGAMFYGAQTRVMDGMLGRANCLLILTFWALFKFALVPIGGHLQGLYGPEHFALLFAFIWGTYLVVDTLSEVGGSLYGTMKIKVRGVGDVNRKSIAGTVTGLVGGIVFGVGLVLLNHLPGPFIALAVTVAVTSSLLELYSPRGTDDFTMATGNALVCWAFGVWVMN
jgi:hypothetical protein